MKNLSPSSYIAQIVLIPKAEFFEADLKEELPVFEFETELTREEMMANPFLEALVKQCESALAGAYISAKDIN